MICVLDFDGTLFKNDFFQETFYGYLIERPLELIRIYFKSSNFLDFKKELLLNKTVNYDIKYLMNPLVISWLKNNRYRFSKIYIVSATPNFFLINLLKDEIELDGIFGSVNINLKGIDKLKFIQKLLSNEFAYLGDSSDDLPIFKSAFEAYKVTNKSIINVKSVF